MNLEITPRRIRKVLDVAGGHVTYFLPTFAERRDIVRGDLGWGALVEGWGDVKWHLLTDVDQRRIFDAVMSVDAD